MAWWWAYPAVGALVGFLAGLLGIGGGAVMVPMLLFVFAANGFPAEHMMHLALATAMATIVFASLSSVRAHATRGGVDVHLGHGHAQADEKTVDVEVRQFPRRVLEHRQLVG